MRSVLLILHAFAPHNNCAAIPNTKLTKYLTRRNVKLTIITQKLTPSMDLDETLLTPEVAAIRRFEVGQSPLFDRTIDQARSRATDSGLKLRMKSETRPLRARVVTFLKNSYFNLRRYDWLRNALRLFDNELKGEHFDVVYSSYPPIEAHDLASHLRRRGIADRWIADFRDPMYYEYHDSNGVSRKKRLQARFEREADVVTIVSEGARSKFLCDGVSPDKILCIPNGYDPEDAADVPDRTTPGLLRIFYAGTLYAGRRDFSVVFRAISELEQEGLLDHRSIRFEYAGNEWPVMRSFAEQYGLADCCVNHGFIPRSRVLELLGEADITAVCTHNTKTDQGVVTGKVFELLLIGKPILTVVNGDEPNSELGAIVRSCNAGPVYEQPDHDTDYPALKQWLLDACREKLATGRVSSTLDVSGREAYSYESLSRSLFALIDR